MRINRIHIKNDLKFTVFLALIALGAGIAMLCITNQYCPGFKLPETGWVILTFVGGLLCTSMGGIIIFCFLLGVIIALFSADDPKSDERPSEEHVDVK